MIASLYLTSIYTLILSYPLKILEDERSRTSKSEKVAGRNEEVLPFRISSTRSYHVICNIVDAGPFLTRYREIVLLIFPSDILRRRVTLTIRLKDFRNIRNKFKLIRLRDIKDYKSSNHYYRII